jgi:serine/threonine-protein kinase
MPGQRSSVANVLAGRYELTRPLGHGGMAEVYLGHDHELDRAVAIKLLTATQSDDRREVRRFRREARAAAGLAHPNVVAIYDIGQSENGLFIVMEHVAGESLRELLCRELTLAPARAANLAAAAASGLHAAHLRGVTHRDVTPGNIMVCPGGVVKVLDFGIALLAGTRGTTDGDQIRGTAGYLSPEQVRGGVLDQRSDVYSLGCCLYEMVTGSPPFQGEGPLAVAYQHIHSSPPDPRLLAPDLPDALEQVIRRTLAKAPEQRYSSAQALADDLAASVGGSSDAQGPEAAPTTVSLARAEHSSTALLAVGGGDEPEPAENPRGTILRRIGTVLIIAAAVAILVALLTL